MLAPRDMLEHVPLVAFLDAYPEPAFILCSNTLPQSSLDFMYGNRALRELLIGRDETGVLDGPTFFSALVSDDDIFWLSNPTHGGLRPAPAKTSHTINIRPAWLPRDHTPVDLEVTPTPIDLPITIHGVSTTSRSYVFTSSPRKTPMNLLRSETHVAPQRRKDTGLRLPSFPPHPASMEHNYPLGQRNTKTKSDSSSLPSQTTPVVTSSDPPSRLIETFPWEKTSLGPRESWPLYLKLMVRYMMEKPIAVRINKLETI
jgi:hypothetical protein